MKNQEIKEKVVKSIVDGAIKTRIPEISKCTFTKIMIY